MNKEEFEKQMTTPVMKSWDSKDGLPENVNVVYTKVSTQSKEDGMLIQEDHLDIYKDGKLIKTMIPALDPYVVIFENYVFMSSDGEFEVFNTINEKYYHQELTFVPFYFNVEHEDERDGTYYRLKVTGEGCYWGIESYVLDFKFILMRDIDPEYKCLDLILEEFYVRGRDEEEENQHE